MNTKHGTKKGTKGGNQGGKGKGPVVRKRVAKTAPAPEPTIDVEVPVEAAEPTIQKADSTKAPVREIVPATETPTEAGPRRWRDMTIEELQSLYLEVVGRPTTSTNRSYIAWKCTQARKGHITVGAIERRPSRPAGSQQVLPLTLLRETTRLLDAAVAGSGAKSRSAFIRAALIEKLRAIGGDGAVAAADALAAEAG